MQLEDDITSKLNGPSRMVDVGHSIISLVRCIYLALLGVAVGQNNILSPNNTSLDTVSRDYLY